MLKPLDDRILQETFAEEDAKAFAELKRAIDKATPPVELLDALLDDVSDKLRVRNEIIERSK
jgi:hypothetical protein